MNRRQFTKGLAALGLVPAMPAPALATAAQTAPSSTQFLYPWAAQFARVHNKCSPALLAENLKIAPEVAQALHGRLIANGVITAPGLTGVSQAAKPFWAKLRFPGAMSDLAPDMKSATNSTQQLKTDRLDELLNNVVEEVEDECETAEKPDETQV